jgi:hypothetical protein
VNDAVTSFCPEIVIWQVLGPVAWQLPPKPLKRWFEAGVAVRLTTWSLLYSS